ncbi:MAG: rRNA maturation RNase YbeY [Pseudomonadota bacterium]
MSKYYNINNKNKDYILNIDINMEYNKWESCNDLDDYIIRIATYVFDKFEIKSYADQIEFTILFVNDEYIQEVNSHFRSKNSPTNCLSFPLYKIKEGKIKKNQFLRKVANLGDVIFAYDVILEESKTENKNFYDHFSHLLIHSLLHLLGFDHIRKDEAIHMEKLEEEFLSYFNIQSPYIN